MYKAITSAVALAVLASSSPVLASGSGSGGGGGFGGGFSGASGNGASRVSPEQRLANRGRSQVRKRITCKKCEYRGRLNQQTAPEVARAVRDGQFELNDKNRTAVLFFLRQRYGV